MARPGAHGLDVSVERDCALTLAQPSSRHGGPPPMKEFAAVSTRPGEPVPLAAQRRRRVRAHPAHADGVRRAGSPRRARRATRDAPASCWTPCGRAPRSSRRPSRARSSTFGACSTTTRDSPASSRRCRVGAIASLPRSSARSSTRVTGRSSPQSPRWSANARSLCLKNTCERRSRGSRSWSSSPASRASGRVRCVEEFERRLSAAANRRAHRARAVRRGIRQQGALLSGPRGHRLSCANAPMASESSESSRRTRQRGSCNSRRC